MNTNYPKDEIEKVKPRRYLVGSGYLHINDAKQPELHVFAEEQGDWQVWLNTGASVDFNGLCLATGEATRDAALWAATEVMGDLSAHCRAKVVNGEGVDAV